jgi:archaellum biogenesis ATPase FlaH
LNYISDLDYNDWISTGQELFELGDVGFQIWDDWSSRSVKYDPGACIYKWSTFTGSRTGYEAIFAKAQRNGWINPKSHLALPPIDTQAVFNRGIPLPPPEGFPFLKYSLQGKNHHLRQRMLDNKFVLGKIALLGQATTIYAKPNTGKTLLTLKLLIDAINANVIRGDNVFYINADDSINGLIHKNELAEKYGFHMLAPNEEGFTITNFIRDMLIIIEHNLASEKIIILDTLKKFTDLMDKSNSSRFMSMARDFIAKGGTLVMLAHVNKNRDANGKVVFGGTSDISDDCDCAYTLDEITGSFGRKHVLFENFKRRGQVAAEAGYSYSIAEHAHYEQLVESVQPLNDEVVKIDERLNKKLERDEEIIDAILDALENIAGVKNTQNIILYVTSNYDYTKHQIRDVIYKYTGDNYKLGHRWAKIKMPRNEKIYVIIPKL